MSEDKEQIQLEKVKHVAGSEQKAVVMATYVDDCDMDGRKDLRNLMWAVVRMYFESAEPEGVTKLLGIVHEVRDSEVEPARLHDEPAGELVRRVETHEEMHHVGQAGPPP